VTLAPAASWTLCDQNSLHGHGKLDPGYELVEKGFAKYQKSHLASEVVKPRIEHLNLQSSVCLMLEVGRKETATGYYDKSWLSDGALGEVGYQWFSV